MKTLFIPILLILLGVACTTAPKPAPEAKLSPAAAAAEPSFAVASVASLIAVNQMLVREPQRFRRALCSDGNIYELNFVNGRFSMTAEPLAMCVLLTDTRDLKILSVCGDRNCELAEAEVCTPEQQAFLGKTFAAEQQAHRCWRVGETTRDLQFFVLMSRVAQHCQAQVIAKTPKSHIAVTSLEGRFEKRKTDTAEGEGCWWEAGSTHSFETEWFGAGRSVMPILSFQKGDGLYTVLRTSWTGTETFRLYRLDGESAREIESFVESDKNWESPVELPQPVAPGPSGKGNDSRKVSPAAPPAPEAEQAAPEIESPEAETEPETSRKPTDAGAESQDVKDPS